jgi:hypothetical protein
MLRYMLHCTRIRSQDSQRRQCKHRELSLPLFPRRFTFALIGKTPEPRWGTGPILHLLQSLVQCQFNLFASSGLV